MLQVLLKSQSQYLFGLLNQKTPLVCFLNLCRPLRAANIEVAVFWGGIWLESDTITLPFLNRLSTSDLQSGATGVSVPRSGLFALFSKHPLLNRQCGLVHVRMCLLRSECMGETHAYLKLLRDKQFRLQEAEKGQTCLTCEAESELMHHVLNRGVVSKFNSTLLQVLRHLTALLKKTLESMTSVIMTLPLNLNYCLRVVNHLRPARLCYVSLVLKLRL